MNLDLSIENFCDQANTIPYPGPINKSDYPDYIEILNRMKNIGLLNDDIIGYIDTKKDILNG